MGWIIALLVVIAALLAFSAIALYAILEQLVEIRRDDSAAIAARSLAPIRNLLEQIATATEEGRDATKALRRSLAPTEAEREHDIRLR